MWQKGDGDTVRDDALIVVAAPTSEPGASSGDYSLSSKDRGPCHFERLGSGQYRRRRDMSLACARSRLQHTRGGAISCMTR
jgi:hypothetical protein